MIVTGYYHNGKIEIPEEYRNLKENTPVKVEIPRGPEALPPLHPEVEKLVRSMEEQLGSSYSYKPADKTDKEIFAEALKESDKYGK
jgi:hypothetical protein